MLEKILYADDALELTVEWLGFGAIKLKTAEGDEYIADADARAHYRKVVECFQEHGQAPVPSNRRFSTFARQFAEALRDQPVDGPAWRRLMRSDPRRVAESYVTVW